ncbi:carbohydrate ABC transporter permease [Paenibacillus alkaliterrae]|uniref:carbohydrate ABC transporter permease n=1 Tax=Paenibacillus alkaliterrae TaxID=320909 RepID=UPI001F4634F0|nr:carbohydrate ABC transporter permease [Paenibacillus alkaliterrae]MCF2940853.1 carbohydrate ABC transporter permease [Paenibacillus alkaliterrae]
MADSTVAVRVNSALRTGKKISPARILIYLILISGSAVMIFPFLWLLRSSLMENSQIFIYPPQWIPEPFMWSNFSESLTSVPFGQYFINTMTIELFTVSGVLFTSIMSAYSFARLKWPGRDFVFALLLGSMMLPYAVTLIPTFMLWKSMGALDSVVPLTVPAWFGGGAFNIFLLRQFFMGIPKELDEAAYMDGAKPFTVLWRVILPLAKPALIVVGIFSFIDVWNDFLGPIIYLNSNEKFTLALGLATFKGLYNAQWGFLMAASATIVAPILLLFFFAQRYFIEGITLTGIKG